MKWKVCLPCIGPSTSPSVRRAWVEITSAMARSLRSRSPSVRRAWVEICRVRFGGEGRESPSVRRAWVEISATSRDFAIPPVALRKEGVG